MNICNIALGINLYKCKINNNVNRIGVVLCPKSLPIYCMMQMAIKHFKVLQFTTHSCTEIHGDFFCQDEFHGTLAAGLGFRALGLHLMQRILFNNSAFLFSFKAYNLNSSVCCTHLCKCALHLVQCLAHCSFIVLYIEQCIINRKRVSEEAISDTCLQNLRLRMPRLLSSLSATAEPQISMLAVNTTSSYH